MTRGFRRSRNGTGRDFRRWGGAGAALLLGLLLPRASAFAAEVVAEADTFRPIPYDQVFTLLFLMLGPFKIIGPFAKLTRGADAALARAIAIRGILVATLALAVAAFIGKSFLEKYRIPLPVLVLTAGLVLFLVALRTVLQQFTSPEPETADTTPPTMSAAISPLAFPTIVTPHGIAALIFFLALRPEIEGKLIIVGIVAGIMVMNLIVMLLTRYFGKIIWILLQVLGAVLGIIQVALGLRIILQSLQLLHLARP